MQTKTIKIISFLFIFIISTTFVYPKEQSFLDTIYISLIYPQKSNTPKREPKRIEKPVVVKDEIFIDVVGINPEQLKNPNLYVEYFLDNNLIYTTQNRKQRGRKPRSLGFILDTTRYPNGRYTLIINLWDKEGPSAIGIREIIIQNQSQNED